MPRSWWVLLLLVSVCQGGHAQPPARQWSVGPIVGAHMPNLNDLNQGLFRSPLFGYGEFQVDGATQDAQTVTFHFEPTLPEFKVATKAGFQVQWQPNPRHALVLGLATSETTTSTRFNGELPVQQQMAVFEGERRGKLSYTEYTVGWRFNIVDKGALRLYSRLTAHEMFDIDYREDFVFNFQGGELDGVRRIMVLQAQTAALFTAGATLGGEWRFNDWFSLALEGGYLLGASHPTMKDATIRTDVTATDRLNFEGQPFGALPDGTLGYLPAGTTRDEYRNGRADYQRLNLSFDGWQALIRFAIHY